MTKKLFAVLAALVVLCGVCVAPSRAASTKAAKPKAKPKLKAPATSSAPAGDGADEEEGAPPAPVRPHAVKPNVVVTQTAVPVAQTPGAPLRTGVLINAVTRNRTQSKVELQLAQDGKALLPIILSDKAGERAKLAASELQKYLSQISGAAFEIKTVAAGASAAEEGIIVGTTAEFPTPSLNKALQIVNAIDGKEAYAIRTGAKRVLLLGNTDIAASDAVYRLLNELGCRWFFPNPTGNWEVIPTERDLKWNLDITDRPAFLARDIWYAFGWYQNDSEGHPASTPDHPRSEGMDQGDWARRNHMGGAFSPNAGHAYDRIVAANQAAFTAHPEYFALVGGKRQGNQFEYGNADLRKLVCDWAVQQFKDNPNLDMVSVDPADGGGVSESPESKAYGEGDVANAPFKLANEVAVALQKAFPGQNKMVGLYAYNWHSDPPPFPLEPNVYIQLTMGFNSGKLTLDQLFEEWPKKAKNLGFYEYYSTWRWDYDMWPGGRVGNKGYATGMIQRFQKANAASGAYATSISAESSNNWGVNGRGYYLASQLMWNPDLNAEDILDDFYQKAFGPAASAMKKYYDLQDNVPPMSPGVIGELFRRMAAARNAAKNDPSVMRRLDDLANYLHYYDLGVRPNPGKEDRTLQIQTLMYRNRYSNMNHWEAFRQDSIHEDANPAAPKPWKVDKPITHAETEAWFQEGLKSYPDLVIPDLVKFSTDLVPVDLGGDLKDYASPSFQGGSQEFAFYSLHGEPIRASLSSFAMYGGPKQSWELREENGHVLASGKPQGTEKGTPTEINVPVPKPGRYNVVYTDGSGSLYQLKVPGTQPFALQTNKLNGATSLYGSTPDLYFYVPKGVKEIHYYFARTPWSNSGPHDVVAPDGKIVASFLDKNGDYLSVPVPDGMDGKAWHFASHQGASQGFGLGYFHFFNVPDVLSPSPAMMLLPKDLAQKDGLQIFK